MPRLQPVRAAAEPLGSGDAGYLSTKRVVPQAPPRLVVRSRLLDGIDAAVRHSPVTLIRAPAGSGKTALVSSWARSDRPPGAVAWLSLTGQDSQRGRFWRQVFLALAETGANERVAGLALPSPHAIEVLLASMVGALATLDQPIVLVLDDLHEIDDDQIMADLGQLLRTPPPGLRLVLCTRSDPALRLQRLRLAGLLGEIEPAELVFSLPEASELFAAGGLELEPLDAERLWSRTEGWAAGLALTALTLRSRSDPRSFIDQFAGDVAPVADYLLEEVLADQDEEVRAFLLETSVLNAVSGDLADAITGQSGSAVMLERLHHSGVLTIAMDDHREWYRYHGLLRDLLRAVLRRDQPELYPILNARAARWLADHDRPIPAARHAVYADDIAFLEALSLSRGFSLLAQGQVGELASVLMTLPRPVLESHAAFCLVLAAAAIEVADAPTAARWLRQAAFRRDELADHQREMFDAGMAVMRLYQARLTGDVVDAAAAARPYIPDTHALPDASFTDSSDLQALALINLGAVELWVGEFEAASRDLDRGLVIATALGRRFLQCFALAHVAALRIWIGDVVGAQRTAREALEIADVHSWGGTPRSGMALTVLSIAALLQGDVEESEALFDEAEPSMVAGTERPLNAVREVHRARLLRLRGSVTEAQARLAAVRTDLEDTPWLAAMGQLLAVEQALVLEAQGERAQAIALLEAEAERRVGGEVIVTLGRMYLDAGDPDRALARLATWDPGERIGQTASTTHVRALICAARAARAQGDEVAAGASLEQALTLAEPHGRRLPFLEHGEEFAAHLQDHAVRGTAHPVLVSEVRALLATPVAEASPEAEVEDLSTRELEVLRFLPTMLTNREIASELMVSVNTVKTHLKQIYVKLGAHDRRDAVRRARSIGLISGATAVPRS